MRDNLTLAGLYDRFRFPVLDKRYYVYPSSGYEARFYATWKQNRWMTWDAMYQHKEKEEAKSSSIATSEHRVTYRCPKLPTGCSSVW